MKCRCLVMVAVGALVAAASSPSVAAVGDQWILGIDHLNNPGAFTEYTGAGYSGTQSSGNASYVGNAYGSSSIDGTARVYWELSGNSVNNGNPVPTTTELYTLEVFGTTDNGHNNWQPIESQFGGAAGESYPIDAGIPWAGAFGTNHQYIGSDGFDDGAWHGTGLGPQAPEDNDFNAGPGGQYMWLTSGSWLYAKWDFPWAIDRSWSAIRLTQETRNGQFIPEPGSIVLSLLGCGALAMVVRRRRRT